MNKEEILDILNEGVKTGASFAEIYYEKADSKVYYFASNKLDNILTSHDEGVGVRLKKGEEVLFGSTNNLSDVLPMTMEMANGFKGKKEITIKPLKLKEKYIDYDTKLFNDEEKKQLFKHLNKTIRDYSPLITQVEIRLICDNKKVMVASTDGTYVKFNKPYTRLVFQVKSSDGENNEVAYKTLGKLGGLELLKEHNLEELALETAKAATEKLEAVFVKGGYYPVVMGPGFGAVIFHEACGHALEATALAINASVFCNKLGEKIGSDKVTLIDDGTIESSWGSVPFDDEGGEPKKNVLIENGVLKSYMVDKLHTEKMHHEYTGSGRRENYTYAPTSRMTNTYLQAGNDIFEEMIKSVDYGFYLKSMLGGSVIPTTGDFNFAADEAFLIEKGKITKRVKGISLIGNGKDILKNVEMVSDNLKLETGYCGSDSGMIPVTIGQPFIKVSKILVGGKDE